MQQWPLLRLKREIVGRAVEMNVCAEQGGRGQASAEIAQLLGRQDEIGRDERDKNDTCQRRHDAPGAPCQKIRQGKSAAIHLLLQKRSDQKAGDNKKNVN